VVEDPEVGAGCDTADKADACALFASDCVNGCSGANALALSSFAACYEGSFVEMACLGAATKDAGCIAASGIDKGKYDACRADTATLKKVQSDLLQRGSSVHSFPKVTINGKLESGAAQDPAKLKAALCQNGVQAAC